MRWIILLMIFPFTTLAQGLSADEQKQLMEENKRLKAELESCRTNPSTEESKNLMKTLERGKKFQEDQAKALEELDKED